jgi:dimethylglycine dehydrogenase
LPPSALPGISPARGEISQSPDSSRIRGIVDGEWRVVGWVTSGGYAHYVGESVAQGYVPAALAEDESAGLFEIEILGHRRPARINVEPLFDPTGEKMRA